MERPEQSDLADGTAGDPGRPPALPIKQRRLCSQSSSPGSSVDLDPDMDFSSPLEHQNRTPGHAAFPPSAADCHAPHCPIHHFSGHSGSHTVRFLSESTPPPLPKKRLSRALSLPGGALCQQCSYHSHHKNRENPPSAMSPAKGETETAKSELSLESRLTLLGFDTPDSRLPGFFKNFRNQAEVSLDIQRRHLLFLRSMAQKLEGFLFEERSERGAGSLRPSDFVLHEGGEPRQIGRSVFYTAFCPKYPGRRFAAKVLESNGGTADPAHPDCLPPHVNIQQVIAYFPQCPQEQRTQRLQSEREGREENVAEDVAPAGDASPSPRCPPLPWEGTTEPHGNAPDRAGGGSPTVLSLMSKGHGMVIVREMPWGTLEDFVREGTILHRSEPEVYERQLGLLLLQVTQGLQHLRKHTAARADLRPDSVVLVWPDKDTREKSDGRKDGRAEQAEARGQNAGEEKEREEAGERTADIQALWRKRGTPRAILAEFQCVFEAGRPSASEELQLSSLLRYCLHVSENPLLQDERGSFYFRGLLQLATALVEGEARVPDAPGVLQLLLWGPRMEILQQGPSLLPSWLSVKRSLLILKLAERGLSVDQRSLDWEDHLCLQYHCLTPTDTVLRSSTILGLHGIAH
ncbi:inactive tyrosine-protein kinase PEAK1 isoform X2 [Scleropages formosus]|uniref:inactive tyrosine-protein kinase PEAK1 isoform X2 n=1 Tax=Scleropages formosus TaxID=113540 RepID=UPI0010FA8738|nr:inactive tyrosine-protein kinase PEAK1-like isoform X2 [Scleropages formosus]